MRVFVAVMLLAGCGASIAPQQPLIDVTEVPVAKADPGVNILVAEADKTRKNVADHALQGHPSNSFLIDVIGLTHNLDVAVAVLKKNHTSQNIERVKQAIQALQNVQKEPSRHWDLP